MNKLREILISLLVLLCGCGGDSGKPPAEPLPERVGGTHP